MSKRRYGGDRRGTPWYDSNITPEVPQDQVGREFRAQQETVPCRTVEQRAQAMREAESDDIKLNGVGLAILERRVQECSDGVSNLGMRVAKLEDGGCNASFLRDDVLRHQIAEVRAQAEKDRTWTRDLIATWRKELGHKIDKLEARIDKVSGIADRNALATSRYRENIQSRLNRLEAQADKGARRMEMLRNWAEQIDGRNIAFQKRLIEAFPSVGKPTIAEQCAASWPHEEGDGG